MAESGNVSVDEVLEVARDSIEDQCQTYLGQLHFSDLTVHEIIAMLAILRPAYERVLIRSRPPGKLIVVRPNGAQGGHKQ
ncbi:hypothetical protein [Mycolicibacterium senegalense]|uniref:hypothetical protein n=1 Tax=Mycolicibacterium senegalense TaxID=1796 RepID=UPI0036372FD1